MITAAIAAIVVIVAAVTASAVLVLRRRRRESSIRRARQLVGPTANPAVIGRVTAAAAQLTDDDVAVEPTRFSRAHSIHRADDAKRPGEFRPAVAVCGERPRASGERSWHLRDGSCPAGGSGRKGRVGRGGRTCARSGTGCCPRGPGEHAGRRGSRRLGRGPRPPRGAHGSDRRPGSCCDRGSASPWPTASPPHRGLLIHIARPRRHC